MIIFFVIDLHLYSTFWDTQRHFTEHNNLKEVKARENKYFQRSLERPR